MKSQGYRERDDAPLSFSRHLARRSQESVMGMQDRWWWTCQP